MTGPIDFADLTIGMQVTATTAWTATGASSATSATVTAIDTNGVTLSNGDTIPAPTWVDPATTVTYNLDATAPTPPPEPPALGTIYADETGAAWQATGAHDALVMSGIDGTTLDWPGFLAAHPGPQPMQDTPVTPLPAPVSPYPQSIAPVDVKIGMDLRVTIAYVDGGTKVVRGVCVWTQDNDNTDGVTPDYLVVNLSTGDWFAYDPLPDDVASMTVELMQAWTADPAWGFTNQAEPAAGTIIRDCNGIAWQRLATDAADDSNPAVPAGKGQWWPVTQSISYVGLNTRPGFASATYAQPISWFWLQLPAAPFNVQEPA